MVYYSQKYADKQKRDREMVIKKANDLIQKNIQEPLLMVFQGM